MTAREILKILHKDGWYEVNQEGSHVQLKHPIKLGKVTVTVAKHSGDIAPGTLKRIYKQAEFK